LGLTAADHTEVGIVTPFRSRAFVSACLLSCFASIHVRQKC
jgi:hypothetical protein